MSEERANLTIDARRTAIVFADNIHEPGRGN